MLGSLCPVCGVVELQGRQQVCSAACRRERSRIREQVRVQDGLVRIQAEVAALLAVVSRPVARRRRG